MAQRRVPLDPVPPPIRVVLGENVYRRRVLRVPKMSQDDLAEAAGVAANTIQAIESGRDPAKVPPSYPQLDTIEKIAGALGCTVDDLLRWEPEASRPLLNAAGLAHRLEVVPPLGKPEPPPVRALLGPAT